MRDPSWPPARWPPDPGPRRDVRGPARLVMFLLVLGAVPAIALFLAHRAAATRAEEGEPVTPAPAAPVAHVVTPLVSLRRTPATVSTTLANEALVASLVPIGERVPPGSCLVVGVDGVPLFDDAGPTSVIPASNMKLVTAAVALDVLGPDHRFTTEAKADHAPSAGTIDGNLYLVGGGDPVLGTTPYVAAAAAQVTHPQPYVTPLENLADQIVASGVTRITGSVLGDDSRYDAERVVPSWPASYATSREAGPLGALLVNDAAESLQPLRSAPDPAVHGAGVLTQLLRARGVTVAGGPGRAVTPAGATTVSSLQSRPLSELTGELLTTSDNNTAELLLKEIGVTAGGAGTRTAGLGVVQAKLGEWGIPLDGIALVDGSGLDRGDRLTCTALQAVLRHAGSAGPIADGLPIAGMTGTLSDQFAGNPAVGRLHAKTGTLRDAKALSGFVDAADGSRHISFSYVQNGPNADATATPIWDALGRALTAYPTAPPIDQLSPQPPAPPS
jgi:D-alanyl-D-alanine carboxypeptidase/D-alanyl-D-alanine-endopeptidase (penicillin-binding protein 4)